MGVLGGLSGTTWLLPAVLLPAPPVPSIGEQLRYQPPSAISFAEVSAESGVLSSSDRFRIARARTARLIRDWGDYSLAIVGSRARSEHEVADPIYRRDGFATYQIGTAARTELPGDLTLRAGGTLTYMTRRLGPLDIDGRSRHSFIAGSDFSIARGGTDRLTFSFVDVAPASSRTTLARMAELLGGSPRAGRGVRLAFSNEIATAQSGSLSWGLDASAMRLSAQDSLLLGAPARTVDRRIALIFNRRF